MLDRNPIIDGLRGIAMILMFIAHSIPYDKNIEIENFFLIRELCSLAAPVFLFLVGYNFNFVNLNKIAVRILITLIFAVVIDILIWKIIPFYSFDVLYLISFSLIILCLIRNFSSIHLMLFISLIVLISSAYIFGEFYDFSISEPYLYEYGDINLFVLTKNLFFDGWFPFFPWIIFPLIGFSLKKINFNLKNSYIVSISIFTFILSSILVYFEKNYVREFSVEIFYPATLIYILLASSSIILFWNLVNFLNKKTNLIILRSFGKSSLFFYFFHLIIYSLSLEFLICKFGVLVSIIVELVFLVTISLLLERYKLSRFYPKKSTILSIIFGK